VSAEISATVKSTSVNRTMLKKRRIAGDYKSPRAVMILRECA
jgi:hypothetical protein